jgi:WD40 repeat protein
MTEEVLGATSEGDVVRWDLAGAPRLVGSTGRWITELAAGDLGTTVAALDADGTVHLLPDDLPDDETDLPDEARTPFTSALDIAVSPSGMLLGALIDDVDGRRVEVRYAGTTTAVARLRLDDDTYDSVDLGDDYVVLSAQDSRQGAQGGWERRSVPGMKLEQDGSALPDVGYSAETVAAATTSPHGVVAASVHALVTTVTSTEDGSTRSLQSTNTALPVTLDVRTVVFSPNATQYLVVRDQRAYLFDVVQGNAFWELPGAVAADAAAFAAENRPVTAQGRTLTAWDITRAGPLTTVRTTQFEALERQVVSPDGQILLSAGASPGDGDAEVNFALLHDVGPGRASDQGPDGDVPGLVGAYAPRHGDADTWLPAITDDGPAFVVETADGTVRELVQRSDTAKWRKDLEDLTDDEFRTAYSPPIRYETDLRDVLAARVTTHGDLALAAADGSVRVLDPATGDPHREAALPGGPWTAAEISPDGQHVAFRSGATVALVDTATGDSTVQVLAIDGTDPVLAFGAAELVVAHAGGVVVLETDGGAVRAASAMPVPTGLGSAVVLPGTGIAVVSGADPGAILIDLSTGEQVGELDVGATAPALTATTGRLLAIGTGTGNHRVVDTYTNAHSLLAEACAVAGRDLTVEEWTRTVSAAPPADLSCDRER